MSFLNTFITAALCLTMAAAPVHPQRPDDPTSAPQAGQTPGTADRTHTPHTSDTGRHDTTPHTVPALANTAGHPSTQTGNAIGPQDGGATCRPVTPRTWGTPADDATVNKVPGRDPAPVQWEIGSDCTLTLHHGTSPETPGGDGPSKSAAPWLSAYSGSITKIRIDGNVTLYTTEQSTSFFRQMENLREVRVDGTLHLAGKAAYELFAFCYPLTDFTGAGLNGFETSQATDMSSMFRSCQELTSLDLSSFDTGNVTNMSGMFYGCMGLPSLDVSSFDTRKVTDMNSMFYGCMGLQSLDLSSFNTGNVTNMDSMFAACFQLLSLNVSSFNTSNVTNMNSMFTDCRNLTSLDVSSFDTGNVTDMNSMFTLCEQLTSLDVSRFNTGNVTDMRGMFSQCEQLTSLDLSRFDTGNVTDMSNMFEACTALTSLNISHFDTRKAIGLYGYMTRMLGADAALRELWLGPDTYLARTDTDTDTFVSPQGPGVAYDVWLELPATGPHVPVNDLRARTSLTSPRNPQGHYVIPSLTLTVDYDNGQAGHTETTDTSKTAGSRTVALDSRPAPAGKVFDGWELSTSDPEHVTLHGDTVSWTLKAYDPDARVTAKWRTPVQPGQNRTPGQPGNRNPDPDRQGGQATAAGDPDALALTGTATTQALTLLAALLTLALSLLATAKRHARPHTR